MISDAVAAAVTLAGTGVSYTAAGVSNAGTISNTRANITRHAIAYANSSGRDRRTTWQCVSHCLSGHRICSFDLDPFRVTFHLSQIDRAANHLKVRQTDEQNALSYRDRKFGTVICNGYLQRIARRSPAGFILQRRAIRH